MSTVFWIVIIVLAIGAIAGGLLRMQAWLLEAHLMTPAELDEIEAAVDTEVAAAVAFAEAGTWESVDELERFVTMDEVPS